MTAPNSLIDRDDSLLIVVDCQESFLKKLEPQRRDMVLSTMDFLVNIATRLGIPSLVTVEQPERHGATCQKTSDRTRLATVGSFVGDGRACGAIS